MINFKNLSKRNGRKDTKKKQIKKKGFTLVEILIVVAVIDFSADHVLFEIPVAGVDPVGNVLVFGPDDISLSVEHYYIFGVDKRHEYVSVQIRAAGDFEFGEIGGRIVPVMRHGEYQCSQYRCCGDGGDDYVLLLH